jgi:hypothetical protein
MSFEKSAREKLEVHLEMERKWALWKEKIHKIEKRKLVRGRSHLVVGRIPPKLA